MRLLATLSVAVLLLGACGGISADPAVDTSAATAPTSNAAPTGESGFPQISTTVPRNAGPSASSTTRSPGPASPAEVDLVSYIEVIEHLLVGTDYEGMAFETPHVFLATGAMFCDQLEAGASSDRVLFDYIEELTGGPVESAPEDVLTMAGAVLGSGLATMCPHHIATLGITD